MAQSLELQLNLQQSKLPVLAIRVYVSVWSACGGCLGPRTFLRPESRGERSLGFGGGMDPSGLGFALGFGGGMDSRFCSSMASPSDLLNRCVDLAKAVSSYVQKTFRIDIDSLISSIEDKRGQFSTSEFEKLAHCLLEKLKAEISSHEHPYKIDISRDVEILYEHNLGSGASATVFKCKFVGVLAAAKVFHANCIDMQAVEKEAKLFSELRHPNVVQFIGYGVKGCESVIVSELMNKNLRTYLVDEKKNASQGPPLPLLVAINIMLQVAEAMNYLHEMGVINRDLKANNVLINVLEDQDGCLPSTSVQTKLADFGESKSSCLIPGFTTRPVGTARWRAPEVFEDEANREKYTKSVSHQN
ncbi:hypothetical protein CY35_04G014600 [Sphagnum magellanicum]|nr:hypothetical protein CY35_04G014600 [Sphagnum magellanicum]